MQANIGKMNNRQKKLLAAVRATGELAQPKHGSAAWYVWHPEHFWVRVCATCRDVIDLVERGLLKRSDHFEERWECA